MSADYKHALYENPRADVAALVPESALRILDVGCSTGALGASLRRPDRVIEGLEVHAVTAEVASGRLDHVWQEDLEPLVADPDQRLHAPYDCVLLADIIEHTTDPWAVVKWAGGLLEPGGSLVVSIPNVAHAQTLWNVVVRRRWPYRSAGIFDRTHLRWFGRNNIPELLAGTDLHLAELARTRILRIGRTQINRLAPLLGDFGTMQFIFRAERASDA